MGVHDSTTPPSPTSSRSPPWRRLRRVRGDLRSLAWLTGAALIGLLKEDSLAAVGGVLRRRPDRGAGGVTVYCCEATPPTIRCAVAARSLATPLDAGSRAEPAGVCLEVLDAAVVRATQIDSFRGGPVVSQLAN